MSEWKKESIVEQVADESLPQGQVPEGFEAKEPVAVAAPAPAKEPEPAAAAPAPAKTKKAAKKK
jgi:hypothetical protein